MLTLDLVRLDRERGPVQIREEVPPDAELFAGVDIPLSSAFLVDVTVSSLQQGELVVRGEAKGSLSRKCRRCLEPVEVAFGVEVDLLFVPEDGRGDEAEADDGVYTYSPTSGTLALGRAVREEAVLAAPLYVECDEECRGLCPQCGTNLNDESCECTRDERDPRWDALRALKTE